MTIEVQSSAGTTPSKLTPTLAYATPAWRGPALWASFILVITAFGLIGLGGCFLVGILSCYAPQLFLPTAPQVTWTPGLIFFVLILYALAAVCFGAALWILMTVIPRLFKLIK